MPISPDEVYDGEWRNWYVYLSKEEPNATKYIHEPYLKWKVAINEFLKTARGGQTKEAQLCRFLRLFIQPRELGISPEIFLTGKKYEEASFVQLLNGDEIGSKKRGFYVAVVEFLDYVLRKNLVLEDEESGELVAIEGAKNPFKDLTVNFNNEKIKLDETCKPALPYQYVEAVRNWMIPSSSETFGDLKHLHSYSADWITVDPKLIDINDPDCVFKNVGGKTIIWCPIYWLHTYTLASVPARGKQIAYNDSGEADSEIPVIMTGKKIIWVKNDSSIAGATTNQGFIKKYPKGEIGMHFTSNKTSTYGRGYDVAWIPQNLAYWLIRLRKWQQKYNPICKPKPWVECIRTDLNEQQRKSQGSNCFLFRDFSKEEPGSFSARLATRLAAALYASQPKGVELATCDGKPDILSWYKSDYTPHSMRVSLITAYVMEFGLPIEVIMKVVGHSSIVMSIYYLNINSEALRERFDAGEKKALKGKAYAVQQKIEQGRIDEIKNELVGGSASVLNGISGNAPVGNYQFRDYGFCSFGGVRCNDGGAEVGNSGIHAPVPSGHLGVQNCIRCRHFVTGPAFIGGLLSIANEIALEAHYQAKQYSDLGDEIDEVRIQIEKEDEDEYLTLGAGKGFDDTERNLQEVYLRKIRSEHEGAGNKLDMYLCDIQGVVNLIHQTKEIVNRQAKNSSEHNKNQLLVQNGHALELEFEESSLFRQLNEVCENAVVFESASADRAILPRSQMIDKMMLFNHLQPNLFTLDSKQQLFVGNQISSFLLDRLKSWERLDQVMGCRMPLQNMEGYEELAQDLTKLLEPNLKRIELVKRT